MSCFCVFSIFFCFLFLGEGCRFPPQPTPRKSQDNSKQLSNNSENKLKHNSEIAQTKTQLPTQPQTQAGGSSSRPIFLVYKYKVFGIGRIAGFFFVLHWRQSRFRLRSRHLVEVSCGSNHSAILEDLELTPETGESETGVRERVDSCLRRLGGAWREPGKSYGG